MQIETLLDAHRRSLNEIIEQFIPRSFDEQSLIDIFGTPRYAYSVEAADKSLAAPIWDLLDRGGKRWRSFLFSTICEVLGESPEKFKEFSILIELVHNGSLIVDDIEDASQLRRGQPCLHKTFGVDIALNAANAMYFLPFLTFFKNKKLVSPSTLLSAYEAYSQELINIHLGQGMDISWQKGLANADQISEDQYFQMCALKTGTLPRLSVRLAAILCDADETLTGDLARLAECLGVGFQIQDDVLNLTAQSEKNQFVKGYLGSDITEGKRTIMVIHTLSRGQQADRLLELLGMHTSEKNLIAEAIHILADNGSIAYAQQCSQEIVTEAWDNVHDRLEDCPAKDVLAQFVQFAVERDF